MGFDIYGLNPKMNKSSNKFPTYHKHKNMDWEERDEIFDNNEKLCSKYWEEYNEFQKANTGIYFRNNVWWWRPLWEFICDNCSHILTNEQMELGHCNDGVEINNSQAIDIHNVIVNTLGKKQIIKIESEHEQDRIEARENNKGKNCGEKGYDWTDEYPFETENVMEFAEFCIQSGGFKIC